MKPFYLLPVLFAGISGQAQPDSLKKQVIAVTVYSRAQSYSGYYLQGVSDSSISISKRPVLYGTASLPPEAAVHHRDIDIITYRRKGATGRGILIGAGIGALTGVVIGLASGNDAPNTLFSLTAGEKALVGGLLLGVTGTVLGAVAGLASGRQFTIARDPDHFAEFRRFIQRKTRRVRPVNY